MTIAAIDLSFTNDQGQPDRLVRTGDGKITRRSDGMVLGRGDIHIANALAAKLRGQGAAPNRNRRGPPRNAKGELKQTGG